MKLFDRFMSYIDAKIGVFKNSIALQVARFKRRILHAPNQIAKLSVKCDVKATLNSADLN